MSAITRSERPCWLFHNWWAMNTCATYKTTGPLPGELHMHNGLGEPGYRYERVCTDCDTREYMAYGKWWPIPLPETRKDQA